MSFPVKDWSGIKMLPRNVSIALLCCLLAMQNLIVASQQLLLVLLGRIRLLRLMETLTQLLNRRRRRCRFHPYWTFPWPVESWIEIHMHQRNFPEAFFCRHLRMGRDSFDNLLTLLKGLHSEREHSISRLHTSREGLGHWIISDSTWWLLR